MPPRKSASPVSVRKSPRNHPLAAEKTVVVAEEAGGAPKLKKADSIGALGYNELRYPGWLSALLVASSIVMGCGAAVAAYYRQRVLAVVSGASAIASVNYWRRPGPGMRRDTDYLLAAAALLYTVPAALSLQGIPNACFWTVLTGFYMCFRRSFQLAIGDGGDGAWSLWHAAGHTFVSVGTMSAAAGDVDSWRFEQFNPLGCVVFAVVVSTLGFDSWRTARSASAAKTSQK